MHFMKKLFVTSLLLSFVLVGFTQVQDVAEAVLKAYQDRDVELLKKHASGILLAAISDSYFEDKGLQDDLKVVDNWTGEIKDIRYMTDNMMGQTISIATVYYADKPDDTGEIYTVVLSSLENADWVMVGSGLGTEKMAEFEKMSPTLAGSKVVQDESLKKEETIRMQKDYAVEMANGDTFSDVSEETLGDCINKLDDDNFFIILSNGDDFMQAAYSDQGLIVQYKEYGQQFEAEEYLTTEQTVELFNNYYRGSTDWKEGYIWVDANY